MWRIPDSDIPTGNRQPTEDQFASILLQVRKVNPAESTLNLGNAMTAVIPHK
jgi:hypothetical protein